MTLSAFLFAVPLAATAVSRTGLVTAARTFAAATSGAAQIVCTRMRCCLR